VNCGWAELEFPVQAEAFNCRGISVAQGGGLVLGKATTFPDGRQVAWMAGPDSGELSCDCGSRRSNRPTSAHPAKFQHSKVNSPLWGAEPV